MRPINRREMLKGTLASLLIGTGCVSTPEADKEPFRVPPEQRKRVDYPLIKGGKHKIQPPKEGVMIGFHVEDPGDHTRGGYSWLEEKIGKGPKIIIPSINEMAKEYISGKWGSFLNLPENNMVDKRAIPFLYKDLTYSLTGTSLNALENDKRFIARVKKYAESIVKLKRPVFLCTMRELNFGGKPWCLQPVPAKKIWNLMWNIFEGAGANEYTTWVWEVVAHKYGDRPTKYFPNNPKQVDYIGLSTYSRSPSNYSRNLSLRELSYDPIRFLHKAHPEIPIMFAEIGKSDVSYQANWYENALRFIASRPEIVGVIPWDNPNWKINDDHRINDKTYAMMKRMFADDFWIGSDTPT